ncbi:MAG TPA: YtpI family protein [Bacilli bacterium]
MVIGLQVVFYIIVVLSAFVSVYYSIKSRREQDPTKCGLLGAKMNISLGITLIFIACLVMLFKGSSVRIAIGAVFLVIGFFNGFAGIRNYALFSSRKR